MASSMSSLEFNVEFLRAAASGSLERVQNLVEERLEFSEIEGLAQAFSRNSPLYFAAKGGHYDICKYLVEDLQFDVNTSNRDGETPLAAAAKGKHYPVVAYLLEEGANPNLATVKGITALHHVALSGSEELLDLLISKGANVDAISESVGTPLNCAACGKEEAVRILLKYDANPNIAIPGLPTPLGNSIVYRSFQCVKLLVEGGADVNTSSVEYTPLQLAVEGGEYELIKYLLDHGADPNVNVTGATPLEVAGSRGNHKAVEILFPVTTPLPFFAEWSIEGISRHYRKKELDKDKISDLMIKACCARKSKKYSEAIQMYTEVLEMDPNDAAALAHRGSCWGLLRKGEPALDDIEACIKLRPDCVVGYTLKAGILSNYNDPVKVTDTYDQALRVAHGTLQTQQRYWKAIDSEFYWMRSLCDLDSLGFKNSAKSQTIR